MTTIRQAQALARRQLASSFSPALDARLLLQHVLGRDHAYLIAHDSDALSPEQAIAFDALVRRAAAGEPIPYLTGTAPFFGLDFDVTPAVLIPRPETEQLVEEALAWARPRGRQRVVDVGTGSGCIAVSLAIALPEAEMWAVDISADALDVARRNAERIVPGRVAFRQSDLLSGVDKRFDLVAANLPYISDGEWTELAVGVKSYEPALALRGGADGLDLIRRLLIQLTARLNPDGLALLEIGWRQEHAAVALAEAEFPSARIDVLRDFAGHPRHLRILRGTGHTG